MSLTDRLKNLGIKSTNLTEDDIPFNRKNEEEESEEKGYYAPPPTESPEDEDEEPKRGNLRSFF